jgi:hypothetical protein
MILNLLVGQAFPSLRTASDDPTATSVQFIDWILGDLVSSRLVAFEQHQDTWAVPSFAIKSGAGPIGTMTKNLEDAFLAFITEPALKGS